MASQKIVEAKAQVVEEITNVAKSIIYKEYHTKKW